MTEPSDASNWMISPSLFNVNVGLTTKNPFDGILPDKGNFDNFWCADLISDKFDKKLISGGNNKIIIFIIVLFIIVLFIIFGILFKKYKH